MRNEREQFSLPIIFLLFSPAALAFQSAASSTVFYKRGHLLLFGRSEESSQETVHLVSLPPLFTAPLGSAPLASGTKISPKCIRDLWEWKYKCLGDGHDFLVPRPRAISTLNKLLLTAQSDCFQMKEVSVMSNCARFDVIIVCETRTLPTASSMYIEDQSSEKLGAFIRYNVASCLARQLKSYEFFLDLPGTVSEFPLPVDETSVDAISKELVHIEGVEHVARHLCKVAIGIAERPSCPGREVPFRPFSSRDAHIMLQLKRTKELAVGSRVQSLLDASLQAGKKARVAASLPELLPLRNFPCDSPNYPRDLSQKAAVAAMNGIVEPTIQKLEARFMAMDASNAISELHASVDNFMVEKDVDSAKRRVIKKMLHAPTMQLRDGNTIDELELWEAIASVIKL